MTEKPRGIDIPSDKRARWDADITAALDTSTNEKFRFRETNRKLYSYLQRAFNALDYRPTVTSLVDIGIGKGWMLPAIRTAFSPTHYIGVDVRSEGFDEVRTSFPIPLREREV